MATRQPERIARMLIMNTWAWAVDLEDPGLDHELVAWTEEAQSFGPAFFCEALLPGQSQFNAAAADPSRGALYQRVLLAYISPGIDIATRGFRAAEPCAAMQIFAESIGEDNAFQGEVEAGLESLRGKPYSLLFGLSDPLFGALRCNLNAASPCPESMSCECDETLLPSRVQNGCDDPAAAEFRVCKQADGSVVVPYADRFEDLLGIESLVSREVVPDADHMIQEYAPDAVIDALRNVLAHPGPESSN